MKFNVGITLGKFVKSFLIAAGVIIVGALLQGLQVFVPQGQTQEILWQVGGAGLIGLVTAALNWLKNKGN